MYKYLYKPPSQLIPTHVTRNISCSYHYKLRSKKIVLLSILLTYRNGTPCILSTRVDPQQKYSSHVNTAQRADKKLPSTQMLDFTSGISVIRYLLKEIYYTSLC